MGDRAPLVPPPVPSGFCLPGFLIFSSPFSVTKLCFTVSASMYPWTVTVLSSQLTQNRPYSLLHEILKRRLLFVSSGCFLSPTTHFFPLFLLRYCLASPPPPEGFLYSP